MLSIGIGVLVSGIITLKYFDIISKSLLIKIISIGFLLFAVLLAIIYRKEISNIWNKAKFSKKTLEPNDIIEDLINYFKLDWGLHVKAEFQRTYYSNVKEGEDKLADFWIREKEGRQFLVTAPLSRGRSAIKKGDIEIQRETPRMDDVKKSKLYSPKQAIDFQMQELSETNPRMYEKIILTKKIQELNKKPQAEEKTEGEDTE